MKMKLNYFFLVSSLLAEYGLVGREPLAHPYREVPTRASFWL